MTAVFRAVESLRSADRRLFFDPYAAFFLRPWIRLLLNNRWLAFFIVWLMIDRRFPGTSATIASRIRFIDDCLQQSLDQGVDQVVILGAGYDSRAYRFGELKVKRVFEVDHPNTQRLKKEKVSRIFTGLPRHVVYLPVDFEKDDLTPKLAQAGYRNDWITLFIWEGVSKYLTADAVSGLLAAVAGNACKGSAIVFDYLFQSMIDGRSRSRMAQDVLDFQARKGEPFIFGLPEENPEQFVLSGGFSAAKNVTADRIKQLYFDGMARARDLHLFWGVIHAVV